MPLPSETPNLDLPEGSSRSHLSVPELGESLEKN